MLRGQRKKCANATVGHLAVSILIALMAGLLYTPAPLEGVRIDQAWYQIHTSSLVQPGSGLLSGNVPSQRFDATALKLSSTFIASHRDSDTDAFLSNSKGRSWSFWGKSCTRLKLYAYKFLLQWLGWSRTDARGLLQMTSMFVASKQQLQQLLPSQQHLRVQTMLDIGAGSGTVTATVAAALAPHLRNVTVLEASWVLRYSLWLQGYQTPASPQELSGTFDMVSLLNVLDRCDNPQELVKTAWHHLRPSGVLLVATVLPFCDKVFERGTGRALTNRPPLVPFPIHRAAKCKATSPMGFEHSAAAFVATLLEAVPGAPFELIRWTRLPYLGSGNHISTHTALQNALFVFRKN